MIKLLSHNTGPSFETLAQIEFIKALNERGLKAELYGDERWPTKQCTFKPLSEFKPQAGDIIINDGIKIQSYFGLINLGFTRFSHGRKKRLLNIIKYVFYWLINPIWLIHNLEFILYKKDRHQSNFGLYKHDLTEKHDLNFVNLLEKPQDKAEGLTLTIFEDIEAKNKIHSKITESKATTVILAGAIREPLYFTKEIIPLINARIKNLQYIGTNEEVLMSSKKSANFDQCITRWLKKINS